MKSSFLSCCRKQKMENQSFHPYVIYQYPHQPVVGCKLPPPPDYQPPHSGYVYPSPPPYSSVCQPSAPEVEQQQQQQQPQVVIVSGAYQPMPPPDVVTHPPPTVVSMDGAYILSCIVLWFCGFLFGMIALIYAGKSSRFSSQLSYE